MSVENMAWPRDGEVADSEEESFVPPVGWEGLSAGVTQLMRRGQTCEGWGCTERWWACALVRAACAPPVGVGMSWRVEGW